MQIDDLKESEFRCSPPEVAKASLRYPLYQMPEEDLKGVEQDICELWNEMTKHIKETTGQSFYEIAVQQFAERVADGRSSMETVKAMAARFPEDFGRAELIRCLQRHFPAETFDTETAFKQQYPTAYRNEAIKAYETGEAYHRELTWKIGVGEATYKERLEELLVAASLKRQSKIGRGMIRQRSVFASNELNGLCGYWRSCYGRLQLSQKATQPCQ